MILGLVIGFMIGGTAGFAACAFFCVGGWR